MPIETIVLFYTLIERFKNMRVKSLKIKCMKKYKIQSEALFGIFDY